MSTEGVHRKLAAILCADVEGYSRLMQDDPEGTLHTLTGHREVFRRCTEYRNGRVVDSPGDNILIEFASATEAVQCAVEIQRELSKKNVELAESRRMQFRIGIDLGELLEKDDALYGDGVNISARLQSLAESGGICISGRAYDQVVNRLPVKFEFLGKRSVKNIDHPIRVYRVLIQPEAPSVVVKEEKAKFGTSHRVALTVLAIIILGAITVWYFSFRQMPVVSDVEEAPKTIAVLPFENLSSDPEQEYFVDGLSEELLNCLAKIDGLKVTSRTSSFSFKNTEKTLQEVAGVLGVENILEGSVRKAGDKLRITAQLIRVKDDSHLWSETYDREIKDIFELQEDIATAVADELKSKFGIGKSFERLGGTDNLEAYEQYLIAQGKMREADYETYKTALNPINKAIEMDPNFALAWASKAWIHIFLAISAPGNQTASQRDAARNAAQKAIELEPNLAVGYYSLGFTEMSEGDWIQAGLSFNKAIDLQTEPLWSEGIIQAAIHYMAVANFQKAYKLHDKLRQNDPLHRAARVNYMFNLGVLDGIRRAEEEYERCEELFGGHWVPGYSYIRILRLSTAIIMPLEEQNSEVPSWDPIGDKVSQYIGTPEKGLAELYQLYAENNSLSSKEFIYMSVWAAYFGDPEFAIKAMEKCVGIEASGVFWVWLPVMKEVRQLPRFKEFLREIGLVEYWEQFGWPDLCRPLDNGDFVCD